MSVGCRSRELPDHFLRRSSCGLLDRCLTELLPDVQQTFEPVFYICMVQQPRNVLSHPFNTLCSTSLDVVVNTQERSK
jgi:hypothetical protein